MSPLSSGEFCQVRYTIRKQTRAKKCFMNEEKLEEHNIKARMHWNHFSPCFFRKKKTFLVYPTLTNFTQRKRKAHDANDL